MSDSTRMSTTVLATDNPMPKTRPAVPVQPKAWATSSPRPRGDRALRDRAGDRHAPDRDQLFDVELHADAEHQQDDADLGQLLRHVAVGHEAWRVRSDEESGDEIPDDRGEADAMGGEAEDQRRAEAAGERQDQIERVHP